MKQLANALFAATTLFGSVNAAHAATYQWNGRGNHDWFKADNWTPAGVPGKGDTAVIGSNFDLGASQGVEVQNVTVGTGSQLNFSGNWTVDGDLTLQGAIWSGSGALVVNGHLIMSGATWNGSGSLTANGPADVSKSLIGGGKDFTVHDVFNSTDSSFSGPGVQVVAAGGVLNLLSDGGLGNVLKRRFSNAGQVSWISGNLSVNEAFQNQPTAVVDLQSSGVLSGKAANSLFQNTGTVKRTRNPGKGTVDIPYTNTGKMDLQEGTLDFTQELTQNSGETDLNGGKIVARKGMKLHGGKLGGSGLIQGDVVNDGGTVNPGHSPGSIVINGNYTQTANGNLNMEVGGTAAGTSFDTLIVNGTMNMAGRLNIVQYNGFLPAEGTNFELFQYYSTVGKFGVVASNFPSSVSFTTATTPVSFVATAHLTSTPADTTVPVAVTKLPLVGATYSAVKAASGTASDNVGVVSTSGWLYRAGTDQAPIGFWAGGTNWTHTYSADVNLLPMVGTTAWNLKFPVLSYGAYIFEPYAKDAAGNLSRSPQVPFLISTGKSTLQISSITANAQTGLIMLRFQGPLDSVSSRIISNYKVTVNGTSALLTPQSINYTASTNTVNMTMAPGALVSGMQLTLNWAQLFDSTGRLVSGKYSPVKVQ